MKTRGFTMQAIGVVRSPHEKPCGAPIQPNYADGCMGEIIVAKEFEPALADLEGFEHIWLLYWFDRAGSYTARVLPFRDRREHGLFATRAPCRPNPIGLSVVRLVERKGNVLKVEGVDVLDNTPLLDIKPYVPDFDSRPGSRTGWFEQSGEDRTEADERFLKKYD